MTRRDATWMITQAAAVTGGTDFFSNWLQAGQAAAEAHHHGENQFAPPEPDRWSHYQPKFFSPEEFQMLDAFTAILIPTDETPGAREAHAAPFIDFVVNAAAEYAPEMQTEWRGAMAWLSGRRFAQLPPPEQHALVERMAAAESGPSKPDDGFKVYRLIKQMTVSAYYTSRAGLIDNLEYKGNAYLTEFPGCTHPEHHKV